MKLIIDITELMLERLKKRSLNWGDIEDIKDSIREGTPLDDLKAEIDRQEKWLLQAGYTPYNVDIAFDAIKSVLAERSEE